MGTGSPVSDRKFWRAALLATAACVITLPGVSSAAEHDALAKGFENPPQSARPRVWWHWMNGNVTKPGIEADLKWMSRVGIGGMQNFDAALETPTIVNQRLVYMSPEWKDAFKYTAELADQLHLELGIAASPGWSETGGPWVKPADGMKKLVWSTLTIEGGKRFQGRLPAPPAATGPFQELVPGPSIFDRPGEPKKEAPAFYGDAAVVAVPVVDSRSIPAPRFSVGGTTLPGDVLTDGSYQTSTNVPMDPTAKQPQYLNITYDTPQTVRSATVFVKGMGSVFESESSSPALEVSADGSDWKTLARIPLGSVPTTVSFPATTARYFRMVFEPAAGFDLSSIWEPAPGAISMNLFGGPPAKTIPVAEINLSGAEKVHRYEAKAGFTIANDYYKLDSAVDEPGIDHARIIDLTGKMTNDGTLDWTPPPGQWRIIRYGYSLTGTENHPATAEATGLEVDKYDGAAVRSYMTTYLDMYADTVGKDWMGKKGVQAMVNDSTEVGPSNWTPDFLAQFQKLRGYDARPWLPVLSGEVIDSRKASDAFLYDFRLTLGDLVATEHYGTVAEVAHERGLTTYGEALEGSRVTLGDDMLMRRYADVPMSAMWAFNVAKGVSPVYLADMKGASSVAHIYGQNLTAAESLTAAFNPWAYSPADLQPMIDLEFASGINRPVIHTSVHQPTDDKLPGLSLMIFGQYFNRHETWAEMAKPWVDYLSRNSFMLQQGRNLADVAYFYGEEAPLVALYQREPVRDAPKQYAYDFIDADSLKTQVSVENGDIVARGGARYRVLYLGGSSQRMTVGTLRRLTDIVAAGATVIGRAPVSSPSGADDAQEFERLVHALWAGGETTTVGKGKVIDSAQIEPALKALGVIPDIEIRDAAVSAQVLFVHRRLDDGDVYFLSNRSADRQVSEARFRVAGKKPEIWRADTGAATAVSYRIEGDTVVVPIDMAARDSYFVVFRAPANPSGETVTGPAFGQVGQLAGPWDVSFEGLAAPQKMRMEKLQSLSDIPDPKVRYFSGVTTYRQSFSVPAMARKKKSVRLDLGVIGDVATVSVNGKAVGEVWRAPYSIDIAAALRSGRNTIEIKVANLWVNRLIGDQQLGAEKVTYTAAPTYRPDAPLRSSGLIGPVTLSVQKQ